MAAARDRVRLDLDLVVLLAGTLVLALVTGLWIRADDLGCTTADAANHQNLAQLYARAFRQGGTGAVWCLVRAGHLAWPPATYLFHGLLAGLISDEPHLLRAYGLLALPLLAWATYHLAAGLGGSRRTGVLAVLLTLFSFGICTLLREVSIDYCGTIAVTVSLLALVQSQGLTRRRWTLLFGAACGLALLFRLQVVFFLALPAVVAGAWGMLGVRWGVRARRLPWIVGALGLAFLVSAPFWAGRLGEIARSWAEHTAAAGPSVGDPRFLPGLLFYGLAAGMLAGWPVVLAALATTPALLRRNRVALLLVLTVVGGLLGQAYTVAREPRYLAPAIPPLAVLAAVGIQVVFRRRRDLVGAVALLLVAAPSLLSAGFPPGDLDAPPGTFVQLSYLRPPMALEPPGLLDRMTTALRRVLHHADGREAYIIVGTPLGVFHTPYLAHRFPGAIVTAAQSHVDNEWYRSERRRRRILALVGHTLQRKVVWQSAPGSDPLAVYELDGRNPRTPAEAEGHVPGEEAPLPDGSR